MKMLTTIDFAFAATTPYVPIEAPQRKRLMPPVIALKNVSLRLAGNAGPVDILHGLTLEVGAQETVGLIGPSGSGK